jgi:hypothetical protein
MEVRGKGCNLHSLLENLGKMECGGFPPYFVLFLRLEVPS